MREAVRRLGTGNPRSVEEMELFGEILQMLTGKQRTKKLPGPRQIPDPVGKVLVTDFNMEPNWTWKQRAVVRPIEGRKSCFDVRVFDQDTATAKEIAVKDYTSLDEHPELILYEGWFNSYSNAAEVQPKRK